MKLLITGPFDDDVAAEMFSAGAELVRIDPAEDDLVEVALRDADGYVLGGQETVTREMVENAARLRSIVFLGEQPDTFLGPGVKELLAERGISLESTPGSATNAVAEMACALILCGLRRIPFLVGETRRFRWPTLTGEELCGSTIGIYGMGKIGYTVVERLVGFEFETVLYSDVVPSTRAESDFGAQRVELSELFSQSDVVSLHAPLTPETEGSIGDYLLGLMRPWAVLVNTARAGIVDPHSLRRALSEGWLYAAAFDGYYLEGSRYLSGDDPYGLLEMRDRFFLTSHQAFNTRGAIRRASEMALEKLTPLFAGSVPGAEQKGSAAASA